MSGSKNIVFDVVGTLASYDKFYETYVSMIGRYISSSTIFERIFWRMLWKSGISEPREFATEQDLSALMKGYANLQMRPGAAECVQKLRDAGFTVWGFTMGDLQRVQSYFDNSSINMPKENLLSCDSAKVGKPDPEAYKPLLKRLSSGGSQPWFAAAHQWDASAARSTGYRGAYCTVWEGEALMDVFGDMDVVAETLPELADKVIAASQ
ncbi:hypothetical protein LTR37_011890 [Vermiconidia calcicola]|uniref:Uncharacterized protein n=1 Tax=Vermiconidia calcicola TaxID=1690605 RepID=A0ACC3N0R0_9PEZI|nr:hypothetical protein LTR37_011890 [Vermiconidia calcicola]